MTPEAAFTIGIAVAGFVYGLWLRSHMAKRADVTEAVVERLRTEITARNRTIFNLKLEMASLQGAQSVFVRQNALLTGEVHTLQTHKNDLARMLMSANRRVTELEAKLESERIAHAQEITDLNGRIQKLEGERSGYQAQIAELQRRTA